MTFERQHIGKTILAAVVAASLSACGGDGTSSSTASSSTGSSAGNSAGTVQTTGTATVNWSPPTTNADGTPLTDLAGYRVYYGNSAGQLDKSITISSATVTSYVVSSLTPATYYFGVTSYSEEGFESDMSPLAVKTIG